MIRNRVIWFIVLASLASGSFLFSEETVIMQPFGDLHVYRPVGGRTDTMIILISGDGGWIHAVVDLAEKVSADGTFVVGVNIRKYLSASRRFSPAECLDAGKDFQSLATTIRERYLLPQTTRTVLAGYSSGATLVYAAIAQSPAGAFSGAMSFGFCPDFENTKPFCRGQALETVPMVNRNGLYVLPDSSLQVPWVVFQGSIDEVCNSDVTRDFVRKVPSGEFVFLPKVGHGFAKEKNWLPQFHRAFARFRHSAFPA